MPRTRTGRSPRRSSAAASGANAFTLLAVIALVVARAVIIRIRVLSVFLRLLLVDVVEDDPGDLAVAGELLGALLHHLARGRGSACSSPPSTACARSREDRLDFASCCRPPTPSNRPARETGSRPAH